MTSKQMFLEHIKLWLTRHTDCQEDMTAHAVLSNTFRFIDSPAFTINLRALRSGSDSNYDAIEQMAARFINQVVGEIREAEEDLMGQEQAEQEPSMPPGRN